MDERLRRRLEIGFGLILLAALVTLFVISLKYPHRPRQLPQLIEGAGIVLVVIQLISAFRSIAVPGKKKGSPVNWNRVFIAFGSLILYLVLTYFIGMVWPMALVLYINGLNFGGTSKFKIALVSVLTPLCIYLLFVVAMKVYLFRGILFGD